MSRQGVVTVRNYGAYIARFRLSYRYEGYNKHDESEWFVVTQSKSLALPPYATNVHLTIENMIFILVWRKVYQNQISPWNQLCIVIGGTTLDPWMKNC
jgi:hypothetical protein